MLEHPLDTHDADGTHAPARSVADAAAPAQEASARLPDKRCAACGHDTPGGPGGICIGCPCLENHGDVRLGATREGAAVLVPQLGVDVMLCCRDERGTFTGRIVKAEFSFPDTGGDQELSLEVGDLLDELAGVPLSLGRGHFDVLEQRFLFRVHARHVGNIHWDSFRLDLVEALTLARLLFREGMGWEEYDPDGPFAPLVAEHDAKGAR